MTDGPVERSGDAAKRFVEEVISSDSSLESSSQWLRRVIEIATDARMRLRLVDLVGARAEDPSIRLSIFDALEDVAESLDSYVDSTNATIELLDRSALPVATAAMLSGIGLLVGTGARAGSIALLVCGAVGLSIAGFGRNRLKAYESRVKIVAKKIRRLAAEIGKL